MAYVHNGILFNYKSNEILPFTAKWTHLDNIILSEISQTQKTNTTYPPLHVRAK